MNFSIIKNNNYLTIFLIIFLSFFIDKIYHFNNFYLPAWDQGYHLSNLFKTYNILENINLSSFEWWDNIWKVSDTYRGPLTYIFSSIFLLIFGKSYENSLLSNHIFSIITILCIFNLSKEIGYKKAGIWASLIFALNPYIFDERVDYLIEMSQVCFINLNFYILFKFFKSKGSFLLSILAGITLGFVFLTKPTSILFLLLPYAYIIYHLVISPSLYRQKILYIILFVLSYFSIIYPWLSKNWLTIFTSILNAWQWGIKYQDGLEANTLEGLIFYPKIMIKIIGPFISGSFLLITIINIFSKLKNDKFKFNYFNKLTGINFFLVSFPINILIICTLMSTKDLRFILPIFPSLCILSGLFITSLKNQNWIKFYKIIIFSIILYTSISHLFFQKIINNNFKNNMVNTWPHSEIIKEVSNFSPNLNSVIAVLPDTEQLNTFNLDAEANFQKSNVQIRQIVSNEKSNKEDLNRFNFFLIKDGNQGIMSNNSKVELSKLIQDSKIFEKFKSWKLPDGSITKLFKKKITNESISIVKENLSNPNLDLIFTKKGISLYLKGNSELLKKSNLLINVQKDSKKYEFNISLPKVINLPNRNIEIIKNIGIDKSFNFEESDKFEFILLSAKNEKLPLTINKIINNKEINHSLEASFEINKIDELDRMGKFLKKGEFDQLFQLVALVNQSDPEQEYLKEAEKIFNYRYKLNKKNLDYLYNIAISQILQRNSIQAADTLEKLIKFENNNSNLYLAKSIVDIYNFHPRKAEINIKKANLINNDRNLDPTINTISMISNIINFRIRSLINI